MQSKKAKATLYTILAGILWGTSFPVIKIGLEQVDSFAFVFWRFLVASIFLITLMLLLKKINLKVTNKKLLLLLGVTNGAGYLLQYVGMNYTTAAKASLFINLSAMWVALISPKILGEKFSHKKITGVFAGLFGVILVSTNLNFASLTQGQVIGDLMLIVSGIVWAIFMVYNKKLVTNTSSMMQSMTIVLPLTLLTIAPFALFSGNRFFDISLGAWAAIFYTAIVCWVLPYYLWLEGLKYLSASTSTVLLLSEVAIAVALSIVLLNELITLFSAIGAIFIIAAIILVSIRSE
jgi:drug/metabolite transporter (DMT)-like permease